MVTTISLRHPAVLARQALAVDHLSNGRLNLGIGAGAPSSEGEIVYEMLGLEERKREAQVTHFKEQVEIIDLLLRKRVSSYSGKYYSLKDVAIYPPPIQQPRRPIRARENNAEIMPKITFVLRYVTQMLNYRHPRNVKTTISVYSLFEHEKPDLTFFS